MERGEASFREEQEVRGIWASRGRGESWPGKVMGGDSNPYLLNLKFRQRLSALGRAPDGKIWVDNFILIPPVYERKKEGGRERPVQKGG